MTDDEILAEAIRIKNRRMNESRLKSFEDKVTAKTKVTIRWDNPGSKFGESYTSIEVSAVLLLDIVRNHFAPLITKSIEGTPK